MEAMIEKMSILTTEEMVDLMVKTWNKKEGKIIREVAFEVIEDRHGEEISDLIYNNLWDKMHR